MIYTNGAVTVPPVCNGCTFTGNAVTGDLSIKLTNIQAAEGGTYKHSVTESSNAVKGCVTVYILGIPESPTIQANNNNIEGRNIRLTCNSKSTTNPRDPDLSLLYKWMVNNTDIPDDERYVYSQSRHTLTINNLEKQDASKRFTCEATESGSRVTGLTSRSSNEYIINVLYGPRSSTTTLSPPDITYTRDENSYLGNITCFADCNPACNYKWTKPGNIAVSSNEILSLASLNRNEASTYTCTATNPQTAGTVTKSVTINVIYGPDANSVKLNPTGITHTGNEGSALTNITCSTDCYPACNYKWTKSGPSNVISSNGVLALGTLNRNEAGVYTCTATNPRKSGSDSKQVTVYVTYGPNKCEINVKSPFAVREGTNLSTITCHSDCNPSCMYAWRNGSTGNIVSGNATLIIDTVTRYQAGNYTCSCKSTTTEVFPHKRISTLQIIVEFASFFIENHIGQKDVTVDDYDTDIRFTCEINSYQGTSIQIMYKDVILKEQYHASVLAFTRSSITCFDAGVYTCRGVNKHRSSISENISLFVRCAPRPLQKIKKNITSSLYVPVTISFTTLSYPEPGPIGFLWQKEDGRVWTPLLSNTDFQISSSGLQSNLTIFNVSHSDYGRYRVTVKNEIGIYEQYLYLEEEDLLKQPVNSIQSDDNTDKRWMFVGIAFTSLSAILIVYAIFVTILLKRKTVQKGVRPPGDSNMQARYINLAEDADVTLRQGTSGSSNNSQHRNGGDSVKLYTDLARYSKDDKTTYDVIQTIKK